MSQQEPPFPKQIEEKIEPDYCQFPFVQLKSLVEENAYYLASKKDQKNQSQSSDGSADLSQHLTHQHQEVEIRFTCSVCPESYKTIQDLNLHLETQHPDQFQLRKERNVILTNVNNYQCPHCTNAFVSQQQLSKHIGYHTKEMVKKSFVCDICGAKYRRAQNIRKHQEKCQPKICEDAQGSTTTTSKCFICLFCGYKAPNGHKLKIHNRSHTGEKAFECKVCHVKFRFKYSLTKHIRVDCPTKARTSATESDTEDAQGGYKCSICDQIFKTKLNRKNHEAKHGDKFMCQFCTIGFETQQGLRHHKIRAHSAHCKATSIDEGQTGSNDLEVEVKYDIHVDPLAIPASPDQLARKKIDLSKEKIPTSFVDSDTSLKCHICSKKCKSQGALTNHLGHQHPEVEKPFSCSVCFKSCKTSEKLHLHLGTQHPDQFKLVNKQNRVYAAVKKCQCPHCPQKFVSPSRLMNHISSHSDELAFVCDLCGSKHRRIGELRSHKSKNKCKPKSFPKRQVKSRDDLESHNQSHNTSPGSLETTKSSIVNEILEHSDLVFGLEDETDIKYEIPDPLLGLAIDDEMCQSNINLVASNSEKSVPIDPISSWVQSVTNSSDPLALNSLQSDSDFIPTTVLKMEY